jgi:hypothetical protein
MPARIFTPVIYLPGLNPGGLAIRDGYAYVVDRGWPAQDLGGNVNDEPEQTRGGKIVKIDLNTRRLVDDDAWPSAALVEPGTPSPKPYFGPFINDAWMYVCAHGLRESAPDVPVNNDDEQTGAVYRLHLSDGTREDDTATNLDGPFSITFDGDNRVYVTNTRSANRIIRFDTDLTNATAVSINLQGDRALEVGGILFCREGEDNVLYVTDRSDDPAVVRGTDPAVAAQRGRVIRIVLDEQNNATVYANDLDRPIALAFDPADDLAYVLCAWPRSRSEIGVAGQCLPPWRTWRNPLGAIRRASRPDPLTFLATVSDFAPALVDPRGLAIRQEDGVSFLYVVTTAGPPPTPADVPDGDVTTVCDPAPTWTWVAPPSGMLYKVSLE